MLNHIVMAGRLTKDPELRKAGEISVCSFRIACDRDFKTKDGEKETDFVDVVVWRKLADNVAKYFTKGRMAVVSGRLQIRNWTDKEGNKRRSAEVVADNIYFGDSKRDTQADPFGASYSTGAYGAAPAAPAAPAASFGAPSAPAAPAPASDFAMLEDDDDQPPF